MNIKREDTENSTQRWLSYSCRSLVYASPLFLPPYSPRPLLSHPPLLPPLFCSYWRSHLAELVAALQRDKADAAAFGGNPHAFPCLALRVHASRTLPLQIMDEGGDV